MVISTDVKRKLDATGRVSIPAKYKNMIVTDDVDKVELMLIADSGKTYIGMEIKLSDDYVEGLKNFVAVAEN